MINDSLRPWLRAFGNLAAGETVNSALRLVATLWAARRLGPEAFGAVSVGFVVSTYLVVLAQPGLELAGTRGISIDPSSATTWLSRVVGLRAAISVVTYTATAVITLLLPLAHDLERQLLLFGLVIFAQAFDVRWAFVGIQRTLPVALASIAGAVLYFGSILTFVGARDDLLVVPLAHVAAAVLTSGLLLSASRRRFGSWAPVLRRGAAQRALLWESSPLALTYVARSLAISIDILLVRAIRPTADAGQYAAASRVTIAGLTYLSLYYSTFLPSLVKAAHAGREQLDSLVKGALWRGVVLGLPIAVGGIALAPVLVPPVFGRGYEPTVGLLQVLFVALFLVGCNAVVTNTLVAMGRDRVLAMIVVVSLAVCVTANLALLPTIGTVGASIATVMTEAVVLLLGLIAVRRAQLPAAAPGDGT